MKKTKNLLLLAFITIIILSIIAYYYLNHEGVKNSVSSGAETPNTVNDHAYFTYRNNQGGFSLSLPLGWGVMDTDGSGNQISGLDALPSPIKQISQNNESGILSSATKMIQVSTITPSKDSLNSVWTKMFSTQADANVSNPSQVVKSVKVQIGQIGGIKNCTGYEYQVLTSKRIYSFTGCAVSNDQVVEVKGYMDKMVQTLQEN